MLASKKIKLSQQKPRTKTSENQPKKIKKAKNSSPSKLKMTPEKKRQKKDENSQANKQTSYSQHQSQLYKSKDSQKQSNFHKKSQNRQTKCKLLTTSPIIFQHSKSKQKSKSKSVSKLNTYRSTQDRDLSKSITRRLFPNKESNKSKSREKDKDKSRSRSRLKTDRDVSPLKEIRQTKKFNVADRQIRYNKNETSQLKKTMKRKIQNVRSKAEAFLYPTEHINEDLVIEQPKVKLKKRVPQIKTEFSQRRGSFFDENLLKKLEINHQQGKKAELCPFMHIKSNFQERIRENYSSHSKSEEHSGDHGQIQNSLCRNQQVQSFKRQQQLRWNLMLQQLKNLKNQPRISQRIDLLIENLNKNYTSLRSKADEISFRQPRQPSNSQSNQNLQFIHHSNDTLNQIPSCPSQCVQPDNTCNHIQKICCQVSGEVPRSNESSLKFLSPIPFEDNFTSKAKQQVIRQKNEQINQQSLVEEQEVAFKRSNNINLSEFYNFMEKAQNKRKIDFEPFIKFSKQDVDHFSLQMMKNESQLKCSDKNILNQLNILENSSDFLQKPRAQSIEFKQQMQNIHKSHESAQANDADFPHNFHNEVRINEQMSQQSMLLNATDSNHRKCERVVQEIQAGLILQFCIQILRSRTILNNFITTYSQLVEANAINVEIGLPNDPRLATECSDTFVQQQIRRVINHIEVNYKQNFLDQLKLPFQCKPIDILRFIRTSQEDMGENYSISEQSEANQLQVPYFNQVMIQEFQLQVIKNQYFIPGYFSFNHCIYDEFNDIVDELRPYGSKGKAMFSLELSHPMTDFQAITCEIVKRVDKHLSQGCQLQNIADEKYPNQQGIFELIYFTSVDIVQLIFEQEAFEIAKAFSRSDLKRYAF